MNIVTVREEAYNVLRGAEAFSVGPGTILQVVSHERGDAVGDYIIRTNVKDRPFVTLKNGDMWGDYLPKYAFRVIRETIEIKTVES